MIFTTLLAASCAFAAVRVMQKKLPSKQQRESLLNHIDHKYQRAVRSLIDSHFESPERRQQMLEYNDGVNKEERKLNRILGVSAVASGTAAIGSLGLPALSLASAAISLIIYTPSAVYYLRKSWQERRLLYRGVGAIAVMIPVLSGYYLTVSLATLMYFLTFKFAARTQAIAQQSMRNAFARQIPEKVWCMVDGIETEVTFDSLEQGNVIIVDAGQAILIDGVVVQGEGIVDQHALTGESQPAEKSISDTVLANTVLLSGRLHIKIERTGDQTSVAQIAAILQQSAKSRPQGIAFSENFTNKLMLPLLATSGAALTTVGASGAMAVLFCGYSTPMVSGPLSMMSFLNIASENGILIKDGRSLEKLSQIDTLVFDKTGTLTEEEPIVGDIYVIQGITPETVLSLAALAEYRQTHPIARAIQKAAQAQDIIFGTPNEADYSVGMGIFVQTKEMSIRVGSARFFATANIIMPEEIVKWEQTCAAQGGSLIFVAQNETCIGAIQLQTQLRPNTAELISKLQHRKLQTYILSGDHETATAHLAKHLSVDGYFAEVLPEDKARVINELQQNGHTVCFVGDGLNDALALQQADVSISMRGATSLATDNAQIILMTHSLTPINWLFTLGNQFDQNLKRTLMFAYVPAGALISGVFLLHFGMPTAVLAYSLGIAGSVGSALSPLLEAKSQAGTVTNIPLNKNTQPLIENNTDVH